MISYSVLILVLIRSICVISVLLTLLYFTIITGLVAIPESELRLM